MTSAFGRAKILLGEAVKEDQAGNAEEALKWYKQVCLPCTTTVTFYVGWVTFKIDLTIDEPQGCTELLVAIKEATDPKQTAGYSKALKNYLLRAEQVYLHG